MRNVLRYAGVVLLAGLLAACGSDGDDEPLHAVELPGHHGLGNWLENRLDHSCSDATSASFVVSAGQYRDAGGVRFVPPRRR